MKLEDLLFILWLLLGFLHPVEEPIVIAEREALVIMPGITNPSNQSEMVLIELTAFAGDILEYLGYNIHYISQPADIPTIRSIRAIILYLGHGTETLDISLSALYGPVKLSAIISKIQTDYLFMFTTACYGGIWHNYAGDQRIIVSATSNATEAFYLGDYKDNLRLFWPPTFIDFLTLCLRYSVEESFKRWSHMMRFLMEEILPELSRYDGTRPENTSLPQISDGIAGDVWL